MKRIMLCIAFGLYFLGAYAQSEKSSLIDTILVQSNVHSSAHISKIDYSENIVNTVDALQNKEAIYIRNYGGFNLSTLSLRGGSSSQTGIYWNNLSINNNMLGLLDISLIPISFIENTQVIYGSESTNFGSGNIGGGLYLNNKPDDHKVNISSTLASFNNYSHTAKFDFGNKIKTSIKLNFQHFENDYPYTLSNGEKRILENGNGIQAHAMYNAYYKKGKNKWSFNYWSTYADRNIPFTRRQTSGDDSTIDINNRFNFNFKRINRNKVIEWNSGYFINNNQFFQTVLINKNIVHSIENRIIYRRILSRIAYTLGSDNSFHFATSENYTAPVNQSRIALFGNLDWENKYIKIGLRLRQELIDLNFAPLIPEITISKSITPNLNLNLKGNRVYRNPTLNDLFWVPGGNLNLIPESGWASEFNVSYNIKNQRFKNIINFSLYNRLINNWIIWVPRDGTFIFSPLNISKVNSRGLEISNKSSFLLSKQLWLNYSFNYNLNQSTYLVSLAVPKIQAGDQLFYTPVHQMNNTLELKNKNSIISIQHRYFSESIGINERINAYQIVNFKISRKLKIKTQEINISIALNNLLNRSYEIIEFRPMPGRNFALTLNYKLN